MRQRARAPRPGVIAAASVFRGGDSLRSRAVGTARARRGRRGRIPVSRSRAALPRGLSLALILAEPGFRAHSEPHLLAIRVRVVGDVLVTPDRAEGAAGHWPAAWGVGG